jgi:hypothetical protein
MECSIAHRYLHEGINVLAAQPPGCAARYWPRAWSGIRTSMSTAP